MTTHGPGGRYTGHLRTVEGSGRRYTEHVRRVEGDRGVIEPGPGDDLAGEFLGPLGFPMVLMNAFFSLLKQEKLQLAQATFRNLENWALPLLFVASKIGQNPYSARYVISPRLASSS